MKIFENLFLKDIKKALNKAIKEAETAEIDGETTFTAKINTLEIIKNNLDKNLQFIIDGMKDCKKDFDRD